MCIRDRLRNPYISGCVRTTLLPNPNVRAAASQKLPAIKRATGINPAHGLGQHNRSAFTGRPGAALLPNHKDRSARPGRCDSTELVEVSARLFRGRITAKLLPAAARFG